MDSYYSVIVLFNIMYLEIVSFFTTVEYSTEWMALRMWANSSQIKLSYAEIIKNTPEGVKNTPEGGKNWGSSPRVCQLLKVTKTQENQGRFGEWSEW